MVNYKQVIKNLGLTKNTALALALVFCTNLTVPYSFAQEITPNHSILEPTAKSEPVNLVGIKIYSGNPFKFDFLINEGNSKFDPNQLKEESLKLARYFLAGLATPSRDLWVNLQPGQSNRVIPNVFASTEIGEDMLTQDYILKRLAASLTYPESEIGKKYWDRINSTTSFNRIWIVPESAVIYEDGTKAYLTESKLKVMTEEDYLGARNSELPPTPSLAKRGSDQTKTFKAIILPLIEKEVNTGAHFAQLRQIYHALLLAAWYKSRLKESPLYNIYVNKNKTRGIDFTGDNASQQVYGKYMDNFTNGEYNFIKRKNTGQKITKHQYFSGGVSGEEIERVAEAALRPLGEMPAPAQLPKSAQPQERLTVVATDTPLFTIHTKPKPPAELTAEQKEIRHLGWYIENIRYSGSDMHFMQTYAGTLFVQNNRTLDRPHACNGHCYYCSTKDKGLTEQREQTPPPTIDKIRADIAKAISLGRKRITIAGEETFQDMESFWAIVDECKDKLIEFSIVTNGIYFLQNNPTDFLKELKKRIGDTGKVRIVISWDYQKVTSYGQNHELKGIDVEKKMRETIEAFNNERVKNFRLLIVAHDNETTNKTYARKAANAFFNNIVPSHQNDSRIDIVRSEIEASSGDIARTLAGKGKLPSLQDASTLAEKRPYCGSYLTKIDFSTGEFTFSESAAAGQRVAINPQNMLEVFASPFRRPQGRHLYTNNEIIQQNERARELLRIAFLLRPELKTIKITDTIQLENLINSDETLSTKINLVYLLLDMIETATASISTRLFTTLPAYARNTLESVPYPVAEAAAHPEIIDVAIQISQYLEARNKRKSVSFLTSLSALDPDTRAKKIREHIIDKLAGRGIIAYGTPSIPKDFEQKQFRQPNDSLSKLPADVEKTQKKFETSVSAKTPNERRFALNRLGIMANEKSSIKSMEALCKKYIDPAVLSEDEQYELIHIFADWVIPGDNQHNTTLAGLIARFAESPSMSVRYGAREKIIEIKDSLPQEFYTALMKKIDQAITSPTPSAPDAPQVLSTTAVPTDATADTQGGVNFDIENKNVIKTRGTFNNQGQDKCPYPENITGLTVQFVDFEKI